MTRKPGEYNIFVTIGDNFAKIRSHVYLGQETYWLGFWVKAQRSMLQQVMTQKTVWMLYFRKYCS